MNFTFPTLDISRKEVSVMIGKSCHLNSSSIDDLRKVSGINENEARKLIDYRDEHGPFRSVDDLMNVPGFGPGTVEKFKSECDLE